VAAEAREIPVYPGAKLVTEQEPREDPACCDFAAAAAFEEVRGSDVCDLPLFSKIIDSMNLAGLPKYKILSYFSWRYYKDLSFNAENI